MSLLAIIGAILLIEAVTWIALLFLRLQERKTSKSWMTLVTIAVLVDIILALNLLNGTPIALTMILVYVILHTIILLHSVIVAYRGRTW